MHYAVDPSWYWTLVCGYWVKKLFQLVEWLIFQSIYYTRPNIIIWSPLLFCNFPIIHHWNHSPAPSITFWSPKLIWYCSIYQQRLFPMISNLKTHKHLQQFTDEFTIEPNFMGLAIGTRGKNINEARRIPGIIGLDLNEDYCLFKYIFFTIIVVWNLLVGYVFLSLFIKNLIDKFILLKLSNFKCTVFCLFCWKVCVQVRVYK